MASNFKVCSSCPTPAKCKKAGQCAKKLPKRGSRAAKVKRNAK